MRLLVIDDELSHRLIIKRALNQSGLGLTETFEAGSIEELATVLSMDPQFSVVFLDVHFSGTRGPTLIPRIKSHSPEAYIICISTSELSDDVLECYKMGADTYVTKGADLSNDIVKATRFAQTFKEAIS